MPLFTPKNIEQKEIPTPVEPKPTTKPKQETKPEPKEEPSIEQAVHCIFRQVEQIMISKGMRAQVTDFRKKMYKYLGI